MFCFSINRAPPFLYYKTFHSYYKWATRDLKVLLTFLFSKLANSKLLTDKMSWLLFCYSSWRLPQWENFHHTVNVLTLWIHCTGWNRMFFITMIYRQHKGIVMSHSCFSLNVDGAIFAAHLQSVWQRMVFTEVIMRSKSMALPRLIRILPALKWLMAGLTQATPQKVKTRGNK